MNDYEILKYLGLEIKDESIIFYDDYDTEHVLEVNEIQDISLDKAYTPIEKKIGFWLEKLFVMQSTFGFFWQKKNLS